MNWPVESDVEFAAWLLEQAAPVRKAIAARVIVLGEFGPSLSRPHVDTLKGSTCPNMKELRVQIGGDPWRVFFAFDPRQAAILLLG
ncbi:MAG: type II toxin-antitoxin system RelE/ParE family toxin, partial [Pigmentiphaga sp.]